MKKFTALLVAIVLMMNMMAICASAANYANAQPIDITNNIKWVTLYEMYEKKLPVVRADAVFIPAVEYEAATAPGSGMRTITITDWAEKGMTAYFDDYFNLGDGFFMYDGVWANSVADPYDHGLMTYSFNVPETGTYEIVFLGCAQIKEENVDNNEKDRGFAFQIDDGDIMQVNISDTEGTFREYAYNYNKADLEAGRLYTTNGVNNKYYLPTYYYGIQLALTAGSHTLDFYHLFSSGDFVFESGNGPRLNYFGAYVQKYLTDAELAAYVYPELTTEEVTTAAPEPETTKAPETEPVTEVPETEPATEPATEAPETQAPAPAQTEAPATEAPKTEGGCGGMIAGAAVLVTLLGAAVVFKKKD